jgi:hypothetical protein
VKEGGTLRVSDLLRMSLFQPVVIIVRLLSILFYIFIAFLFLFFSPQN